MKTPQSVDRRERVLLVGVALKKARANALAGSNGNSIASRDSLDDLIYKTVAISFPLLTFMIIAGAYWANRTWGAYWSWDPKEDWALITWLTYAGYLHMRLTRGWRGRRSAYFAIIGFGVVMFTFFGVTYLLPGLHAYA